MPWSAALTPTDSLESAGGGARSLIVFVGGAGDGTTKIVPRALDRLHEERLLDVREGVRYFRWWQQRRLRKCLDEAKECGVERIAVVGHSYGAATAFRTLRKWSKKIPQPPAALLLTVDPVSWLTRKREKPACAARWINVWVRGVRDHTDVVALLGGRWGRVAAAENFRDDQASHASFGRLLRPHLRTLRSFLATQGPCSTPTPLTGPTRPPHATS